MGLIEAAIAPCLTVLVANFYKKSEQPPRNASEYLLKKKFVIV